MRSQSIAGRMKHGLLAVAALTLACSCKAAEPSVMDDGGACIEVDGGGPPGPPPTVEPPVGPCRATIRGHSILRSPHVRDSASVDFCGRNPPTSGPHRQRWAAYTTHTQPVPREYYVHNLEHGAIVFAYKCGDAASCEKILEGFRAVIAKMPPDPDCDFTAGLRSRVVVTPDPLLDVPVAVLAWGTDLKADCVDVEAMTTFAIANYGLGPESTCEDGDVRR